MNRDYTLVMGVVVFYGFLIIILNFVQVGDDDGPPGSSDCE